LINESNRRIFYVTVSCLLAIVLVTTIVIIRDRRPSAGKPYERLTVEEAAQYMSYEEYYLVIDVRSEEEYGRGHIDGAVNLPYDTLLSEIWNVVSDSEQTLYVYADTEEKGCAAAQKLTDAGLKSVAEIGTYEDWLKRETEDEDLVLP